MTQHVCKLRGINILGSFVRANVSQIGPEMAFPGSGSKITVVTATLMFPDLTPWTKSPLTIIRGGSVHPFGLTLISALKRFLPA